MNFVREAVPHVAWPPFPNDTLGILQALRATETLTPAEINAGQLSQLRELAAYARTHTSWGRETLPEELTWETFHALPILDRAFVQTHEAELQADQLPPEHGAAKEVRTSGSTGTPVRVWKSALATRVWLAVTAREHQWHQRDLALTLAAIRLLPGARYPGSSAPSWGSAAELIGGTGKAWGLHLDTPVQQQIDWLDDTDCGYLLTFPSNLSALLRACADQSHSWPGLRQVRTVSEVVTDELRDRCREILGVEIVDVYSTQELGYIALQRPDGPGYYAMSDTHVVEVLTDDNRPCKPGEIGRVVVTALHNFAMPMFRYDVGDRALVGESGSLPYVVLEKIFGRTRNLFLSHDQTLRIIHWDSIELARMAPILQHQLVQTSRDHIVVRLVVQRPVTDTEEHAMRTHLAARTPSEGIHYTFEYVDSIARGPGGKFEDFICQV